MKGAPQVPILNIPIYSSHMVEYYAQNIVVRVIWHNASYEFMKDLMLQMFPCEKRPVGWSNPLSCLERRIKGNKETI